MKIRTMLMFLVRPSNIIALGAAVSGGIGAFTGNSEAVTVTLLLCVGAVTCRLIKRDAELEDVIDQVNALVHAYVDYEEDKKEEVKSSQSVDSINNPNKMVRELILDENGNLVEEEFIEPSDK